MLMTAQELHSCRPSVAITGNEIHDVSLPDILIATLNQQLKPKYKINKYSSVKFLDTTNLTLFPNQYFSITLNVKEYAIGLYSYVRIYDKIKEQLAIHLPSTGSSSNSIYNIIVNDTELLLNFNNITDHAKTFSMIFGSDKKDFGFTGKQAFHIKSSVETRTPQELFESEILSIINTPNASSSALGYLIYDICEKNLYKDISTYLTNNTPSPSTSTKLGNNTLYYGAPGTGKSHQINLDTFGHDQVRTVFHPDTQNSDFIGTLKPVNHSGTLSYKFSPGPFSRALVKAVQNPNKHIYLIIEELNRAPAAAVFGELFLLLDREPDGSSSYDIDFPSEEFEKWFNDETSQTKHKLSLPANLSILASMNSADQGVFPLDTAFRRRWISTYMPVTPSEAPEGTITVQGHKTQTSYEWKNFLQHLNDYLIDKLQIEEDRLIGQRFMTHCELQDGSISGKLFIYLWDDLLRHGQRDVLFCSKHKTYGSLHRANEKSELIFSEEFLQSLSSVPQHQAHETSEENAEAALEA